jgi:hypothetical protein
MVNGAGTAGATVCEEVRRARAAMAAQATGVRTVSAANLMVLEGSSCVAPSQESRGSHRGRRGHVKRWRHHRARMSIRHLKEK